VVLFAGVLLAALLSRFSWAELIDLYGYDFFLSNSEIAHNPTENTAIIGIDDESLDRFEEPLILWHSYLAGIINGVADAGAEAIVLDVIPSISLDRIAPQLDRNLIKSFQHARSKNTRVYLGFKAGDAGAMPHRKFAFFSDGLGFMNFTPDEDGRIRKQKVTIAGENKRAYSLSYIALRQENKEDLENIPEELYIDYRLKEPPIISLSEIYDRIIEKKDNELRSALAGKVVFVGATSLKLPDNHPVPIKSGSKRMPGVSIQALATKTLLSGKYLKDIPMWLTWLMLIGTAMISGFLFLIVHPRKALIALFFLLALSLLGAMRAFSAYWVVPLSPLLFGLAVPSSISGTYRYIKEYRQHRTLQRFFKSYVNRHVMEEILENPDMVSFGGTTANVTVLFSDIRDFTTISEKMKAEDVVAGLNRYFTEMTKAVTESNGYLNKYIGDGILAIFGAPHILSQDGALAAVRCGHEMLKRLDYLNKEGIFPGISEDIKIGIGIHTGEAVVGNLGCYEKMDYSIIGDTVNLASRIESKTKEFGKPLLVSQATYDRISNYIDARFIASEKVKGREQEVKLYEVLSVKEGDDEI
jgi:class 3 adenylate cyclase